MIIGIGTDLCEIGRIEQALTRHGDRFARRVLVEPEFQRYLSHKKAASYVAKRFAAKEALFKALGRGIRMPMTWHNVGVLNRQSGAPFFELSAALSALVASKGIRTIHLSITDERAMACAFVVLEG
ncbi:MAG: holo-ACP synthase [Betaproteobacteria bacterium]|nr:holo-ACP synthase [Betaproteobacteria bacterium]